MRGNDRGRNKPQHRTRRRGEAHRSDRRGAKAGQRNAQRRGCGCGGQDLAGPASCTICGNRDRAGLVRVGLVFDHQRVVFGGHRVRQGKADDAGLAPFDTPPVFLGVGIEGRHIDDAGTIVADQRGQGLWRIAGHAAHADPDIGTQRAMEQRHRGRCHRRRACQHQRGNARRCGIAAARADKPGGRGIVAAGGGPMERQAPGKIETWLARCIADQHVGQTFALATRKPRGDKCVGQINLAAGP